MNLYPYQERLLVEGVPRKVIVAGRRTGKTTMLAWDAVQQASLNPGFKGLVLCANPGMRDATVQTILHLAEGYDFSIHNMDTLHFDNGARILVRWASPAAFSLSFIGCQYEKIWLEEPDAYNNPMEYVRGALICLNHSRDTKLLIMGTPIKKPSIFRELLIRGFSVGVMPSWLLPTWTPELEESLITTSGSAFAQEFLGAF
jgi:hypothetical protein